MYRNRRTGRRHIRGRQQTHFRSVFMKQIIACILIVLVVITIKKMDIAIASKGLAVFAEQLSKDYTKTEMIDSVKDVFVKVKTVPTFLNGSYEAGAKRMAFAPPTDSTKKDTVQQIHAAAGGTVIEINESSGYIRLSHGNQIETTYSGCSSIYVKPMEKVKKGQPIASVDSSAGAALTFGMQVDGKDADPADYIDF